MKGLSRSLIATLGAAAIAVSLAACGDSKTTTAAGGGASGTVTLRLGYVTTPQHPYGIAVDAFKKEVETASGGKITIEPIPNYTGGDTKLLDAVSGGEVEMGAISTATWDTKGVNVFQALQAPFLITNYGLDLSVIGGPIGTAMLESAAGPKKLGLVGLGILEGGLRKPLGAKVALKSPADFKGKKIRAPQSKVLSATLTALGAQAVPLPVGDVFTALQNGTVDGMEANLGLIDTNKYNEVAKFVTQDVNLWPFPAAVVINQAQFDKLSADQKSRDPDGGQEPRQELDRRVPQPGSGRNELRRRPLHEGAHIRVRRPRQPEGPRSGSASLPTRRSQRTARSRATSNRSKTQRRPPRPRHAPAPLPAGCKKA